MLIELFQDIDNQLIVNTSVNEVIWV